MVKWVSSSTYNLMVMQILYGAEHSTNSSAGIGLCEASATYDAFEKLAARCFLENKIVLYVV